MTRIRSTCSAALLAASLIVAGSGGLGAAAHPRTATAAANTTLIYGSNNEPDTLNPWFTGNVLEITIFDSLLYVDLQGRLQPNLATSVTHTLDGRTWTFHLRHGVRWADGKAFTSADVAFAYHATVAKKNNLPVVAGWDQIDHAATPDAYTFVCHLKAVNAPFLVNMGLTAILPQHIFDRPGLDLAKAPFNRAAFGTGPFMVSDWKAGDHITLVANPYSWRGPSYVKRLIWKIVPDRDTLLIQLRAGEVDAGVVLPRQTAAARTLPGKRLVQWLNNSAKWVDLLQYGFLREKVVRQALDYATPRAAIVKGILQGQGRIAFSNLSPMLTQYYNPSAPTHRFNLAKASALLAADGFVKGSDGVLMKGGQPLAITLWVDNDNNGQRIDQVLQQVWGSIGIRVTLRTTTNQALFSATGPYYLGAMSGMTYTNANTADPDDSVNWISAGIPRSPTDLTCCNNRAYFHPFDFQARVDALYAAGNSTSDIANRRAIFSKIQVLLADEVPVIFLYWEDYQAVIPADLHGYSGNAFAGPLWNIVTWRRG